KLEPDRKGYNPPARFADHGPHASQELPQVIAAPDLRTARIGSLPHPGQWHPDKPEFTLHREHFKKCASFATCLQKCTFSTSLVALRREKPARSVDALTGPLSPHDLSS